DVSSVTNMYGMFYYTYEFNQPLENWDVSSVTNMQHLFAHTRKFNQPLENWDVSSVTNMYGMFYYTYEFNQPLENWDVSSVTNMYGMFYYTYEFNQPLENWDVSSVTNMQYMFAVTRKFNQPLENWDVSSVTNMYAMFSNAYEFNQPLGNWDISSVTNMQSFLSQVTLSREFYDQTLAGWSQLSLQTGVEFHGGSSKYSSVGLPGREILTGTYGWIITDGGYDPLAVKSVLTSTADSPDRDGNFILNWTAEYQANNYSLYQFSSPITEINGSLTLLVENSSVLSYEITDYLTDAYYFVVTGNNDFGQKLSNCIEIDVDLNPGAFSLSSDAQSPDLDGIFTLSWTDSELVEYYIVYQHSSLITDLNGSLTVVASEFTNRNMNLSDFLEGMYYFLVAAVNSNNITLSNCIQVVVNIPETITVLNPTVTTSLNPDSQLLIQWNSTGLISHVKLEFYKGDSFVIEIIGITENDGEFLWLIPTYIGQSEEYRVKIIDISNTTVFVFSEMFTITPVIPQETKPSPTPLILSIIGLVIATGAAGLTMYMFFEQRKTRKIE
ncbi:MAG: BspA family leucine-rich repeat surface protein, partial [Promethearchaeota archaeon]